MPKRYYGATTHLGRIKSVFLALAVGLALAAPALGRPIRWGPYELTMTWTRGPDWADSYRDILSIRKGGRIVSRVLAHNILDFRFITLSSGPYKDLEIRTSDSPPGTQCCFYALFMSINSGKARRLFGLDVGPYDDWSCKVADFDRNGRREIVGPNARMYPFSTLCYGASPQLYTVVGWDGAKWADVTTHCPRPVLQEAEGFRRDLVKLLRHDDGEDGGGDRDWIRSDIAAYLGNTMKAGGNALAAMQWLHEHLPKTDWVWLQGSLPELRAQVWFSVRDVHPGPVAPSEPRTGLATFDIPVQLR